ncbi:hypothetical protein CesoFtcFv8_023587 [Champsocephalus esox]|uniref:Uncharacterized protein n=1 Tax=Champsocephalus esox TaxID=159716 RepID=A0AAN8B9T8_9TELE|nr:hypothetical protein CesoFtcFv8_023587 [Champsocephalus esox]
MLQRHSGGSAGGCYILSCGVVRLPAAASPLSSRLYVFILRLCSIRDDVLTRRALPALMSSLMTGAMSEREDRHPEVTGLSLSPPRLPLSVCTVQQ